MKRSRGTSLGRVTKVVGLMASIAVLAAACGSSKSSTSPTTAAAGAGTTAASGGTATTAAAGATVSTIAATQTDSGKPKRGGTLTYGQEAETATGFSFIYSQFAISGENVGRAIHDPLMVMGEDGKAHPFLAESMTPNADFTSWTIKVRAGIKFTDGTDLDASAVKTNLEASRCSALIAAAWGEFGGCPSTFDPAKPEDPKTNRKPISTIYKAITVDAADKMTLKIDTLFPFAILDQVYAGVWIASVKEATDPVNGPKNPVGTGPFMLKEWVVNDHTTVVKNPNYWLKAPDGLPYPYLDSIIFKPVDDINARENGLRGGTFDMMMTSNGDSIAKFRKEKSDWNLFENNIGGETGYFMLNVTPTYKGKENPLADQNVRIGLAKCINYPELNTLRNADATPVANGPYPPGSDGYLADNGYPKFDVAGGKALLDAYKASKGITGDLEIEFGTTADPFNKGTNELVASYWKKCGVNGVIDQTEQGQYITRALIGDFQAFGWRNHGGVSPDRNFNWWNSALATDPPGIALNFGRMKDKDIDAALVTIRTSGDPAVRKAAAQSINKIFGAKVYNIWTAWTVWQIISNKKVQAVGDSFLGPDGSKVLSTARVSMHPFQQIWIK